MTEALVANDTTREREATAALVAAVLGFFVITLDLLVVNVALPDIGADLGGGITGLQWVADGYVLMFAALLLSAGSLTDRLGARRAFILGMTVFVVGSTACGLAPTQTVLICARLLQGAGAAIMLPSSLSLIRHAYPDPALRARAIAAWTVAGSIAAAAGPVAGGALNLVNWRMIFIINLPIGLIALVSVVRTEATPRRAVPFDAIGQLTAVLAMGALVYGVIEAGSRGFGAADVIMAFVLAALATTAFVVSQRRGRHPMMPPSLLRSPIMLIASGTGFAFLASFTGVVFLYSLYLQQQRGLTAFATGLVFLPMSVLSAAVSPLGMWLSRRYTPRLPIVGGMSMMALAMVALGLMPASTPIWLLSVMLIPVGITGPFAMQPITAVLLDKVPTDQNGLASGVFNTCRQLGSAVAVAVFGAVLAGSSDSVDGLRICLLAAAVLAASAAIANVLTSAHRE